MNYRDMRGKDWDRIKNSKDADRHFEEAFEALTPTEKKQFFNFLQADGLPEAENAMRRRVRKAKRKHKNRRR